MTPRSTNPEWKYVNLRCYFAYLKRSIDQGTKWVVFEPNGRPLWAQVRRTIEDLLLKEFRKGGLVGDRPEKAYFVKCDRSTMTQTDLDQGRLVVVIGVAALRPSEFVIIRIGQWTADRKDPKPRATQQSDPLSRPFVPGKSSRRWRPFLEAAPPEGS